MIDLSTLDEYICKYALKYIYIFFFLNTDITQDKKTRVIVVRMLKYNKIKIQPIDALVKVFINHN